MCTGAEIAMLAAAGVGTAASVDTARKARNAQKDIQRNQAEAAARVDTEATQSANARLAQRRRSLAANSLVAGGPGMPSAGKPTLGG